MKIKYPCHLSSSDWDSLWFDDSKQRYILMKNSVFYLWAPWFNGPAFPDPVKFFTLPASSGLGQSMSFLRPASESVTTVSYAQLSLDSQLFAVQMSSTKVLISDLKLKRNWTVEIKTPMDNKILSRGLVWSDHGGNSQDLVIVTRRGLELYKISSSRGQCKLSRMVSHRITTFFYEPNHRFFLLASPPVGTAGGDMVNIFQFEMNGYFLNINNHDKETPTNTVRFELLPPSRTPSFELGQGVLSKCILKDGFDSMSVVTLYGTVFCVCRMHLTAASTLHRDLELDRVHHRHRHPEDKDKDKERANNDVLVCYAVHKASVVASHICFLNCVVDSKVRLSVVDNLLLCHFSTTAENGGDKSTQNQLQDGKDQHQHEPMGHGRHTIMFDIALSTTSSQRVYIAPSTSESTPAYIEYVDPLCAPVRTTFACSTGNSHSPVPSNMSIVSGGAGAGAVDGSGIIVGRQTPKKDSWDALGSSAGSGGVSVDPCANVSVSPSKITENPATVAGGLIAATPARRRSNASLAQAAVLYGQENVGVVKKGVGGDMADLSCPDSASTNMTPSSPSVGAGDTLVVPELGRISLSAGTTTGSNITNNSGVIYVSDENDSRLRYLSPSWIWDKEKRCQWQIHLPVTEIAAAIEASDGPRRMCKFLLNRGQFVVAPRPIPIVNRDDKFSITREAKACLLTYVRGYVQDKNRSLTLIEGLFRIMVRPYVSEVHRVVTAPTPSTLVSHPGSPGISSVVDGHKAVPLAWSSPTGSASGSGSSRAMSTAHGMDGSSSARAPGDIEPLVALQQCMSEIAELKGRFRVIGTTEGTNAVDASDSDASDAHRSLSPTMLMSERLMSPTPERLSPSNVTAVRRCGDGALIVSQYDMLHHVWLPRLRSLSASDLTSIDRLTSTLCAYVALLRGTGLVVHPTLSLMLFNHLLSYDNYIEACRLLQFQFFPDATELAVAALELSSELNNSLNSGSSIASGKASLATGKMSVGRLSISTMVPTLQQAGIDMLWRLEERAVAVRWLLGQGEVTEAMHVCIKRKGCWRNGLAPSSIPGVDFFAAAVMCVAYQHKAMLTARKVAAVKKRQLEDEQEEQYRLQMEEQAAELAAMQSDGDGDGVGNDNSKDDCKAESRDKTTASTPKVAPSPASVPAPVVSEIIVDPSELASESQRVRLFHALYCFLKEWDYGLLTVNQSTGKSKLASMVSFPEYAFEQDERTCRTLKEMFGF